MKWKGQQRSLKFSRGSRSVTFNLVWLGESNSGSGITIYRDGSISADQVNISGSTTLSFQGKWDDSLSRLQLNALRELMYNAATQLGASSINFSSEDALLMESAQALYRNSRG